MGSRKGREEEKEGERTEKEKQTKVGLVVVTD